MKNLYLILLSCWALLAASCTQETWMEETYSEKGEVELATTILPLNASRANIDIDGKGNFTEGDRMQLFVLSENQPSPTFSNEYALTLQNGKWTPTLTWKELEGNEPTFVSYYPALEKSGGSYQVKVAYDQHLSNQLQKADLLRAETKAKRGEKVNLNFKHVLSRLTVKLQSNHLSEEQLAQADIQVYAATQASFDAQTGQVKKINYSSLQKRIRLAHVGNGTYQAVLIPQEILDEWKDFTPWITVAVAGNMKEIKAPKHLNDGSAFNVLQPGKQVKLHINIDKEDVSIWANQTKWVYGIQNPPTDDLSKWGYAFAEKDWTIPGLTWDASYGWFDCNKVNPVDPDNPAHDSNMCWAATCSNLIHWYLAQNADYVKRYGYTGPSKYPNSVESEVFQHYKNNFENEGYMVTNGLNWFFTGRDGSVERPRGGFFKKVFGINSVITVTSYEQSDPTNKKRFNDAMKHAFRNKEAIGITFLLPPYIASSHAITVWGADFDSEGFITDLYVAENNDVEWEKQPVREDPKYDRKIIPTGIFKKPVQYRDGYVYLEGASKGAFTMRTEQNIFLGLHKEQWEAYFNR